jgi:hypothetical protein
MIFHSSINLVGEKEQDVVASVLFNDPALGIDLTDKIHFLALTGREMNKAL